MKLARLLDDNLHLALAKLNAQTLPLKTAFALKGIQKKMQEELVKYEECRKEALQKYGKKDEAGNLVLGENNSVTFDDEQRMEFIKELNELVNIEIEVGKISVDALGDAKISVEELMSLDGLVE